MNTIWKFPIENIGRQTVSMPKGAKILCVLTQNGIPSVWASVVSMADKEDRLIHIYGTGHPITEDPGIYIGTYQLYDGAYVFHVFDKGVN